MYVTQGQGSPQSGWMQGDTCPTCFLRQQWHGAPTLLVFYRSRNNGMGRDVRPGGIQRNSHARVTCIRERAAARSHHDHTPQVHACTDAWMHAARSTQAGDEPQRSAALHGTEQALCKSDPPRQTRQGGARVTRRRKVKRESTRQLTCS
jgi:hypothetical protein